MARQTFHLAALPALALAGVQQVSAQDILRGDATRAAIAHRFTQQDEALLDEIQFGCFQYFWNEVGSPAMLAKDRKNQAVCSIASVGFQLSALPIGVERGWVTREQAQTRAVTILRALYERSDNKKHGMYIHFPDHNTGGLSTIGFQMESSTVDTALLFAGAMTASSYFGGEVRAIADRMIADADWREYARGPEGFLVMAWKLDDAARMDGPGQFTSAHWQWASDEERLIYFIACAAPTAGHAVDPKLYYKLKRPVERHKDMPPFVVSWPGTLFTYFFASCWVDYRALDADNPKDFGVDAPRVDWFENSRRAVLTHRARCIELSDRYKTLSADRWGLSACMARDGYIVPEIQPNLSDKDILFEGTVTPYAAGSSIVFAPLECIAALRAMRELKDAAGKPLVWRDPKTSDGYGLVDSFNLDQNYVCDDYVGIDEGPMLLAIENARTGLIWRLFMRHDVSRRAVELLKLRSIDAGRP